MTNNTDIYGIIGKGINHSPSPAIYNELFSSLKIAGVYNVFELAGEQIADFVDAARLLPLAGFNVTTPHKRAIVPLLDRLDWVAEQTKAVNLVLNRKGTLIGYNTDYEGLRQSIETRMKCDVKGAEVAIIGSGGSAQTAYYYLVSRGARTIRVFHHSSVSLLRFGSFARKLARPSAYQQALIEGRIDDLCGSKLCINCTPVSIATLVEPKALRKVERILELRYGSYKLARRGHLRGNYMLAVQAAKNFNIMTGRQVTVNRILRIIERTLANDKISDSR